ncbi:MAG: sulfotransferase domain-containing protein [Cyanobacteriota bacterium]|jgi:aryl sulfotransferase
MLLRKPSRIIRNSVCQSVLWDDYRPRDGDIIIATFPRSGTTWMQQIVSLLIFQTAEPRAVWGISPHVDGRPGEPIETIYARLEAQMHRRFLKSHLPIDALPFYTEVRYIHVARDPRDSCLSLFDYLSNRTSALVQATDRIGLEDPQVGHTLQAFPQSPTGFFKMWLGRGVGIGAPFMSDMYFDIERSFWQERHRPNVLLVHYADLSSDLAGEMSRVSKFLDIPINLACWGSLVDAATFVAMKRSGAVILPGVADELSDGVDGFLARGSIDRWKNVLAEDALESFGARLAAETTPDLAQWLLNGRNGADPRTSGD